MRTNAIIFLATFAVLFAGCATKPVSEKPANVESTEIYQKRIEKWRDKYESELKADDGWLTLAGLFWLEEGNNSIGVGKDFDVHLPERLKAGKFGVATLIDSKVLLAIENGVAATVNDKSVTNIELAPDTSGKPTIVKSGDIEFLVLIRNEKFGIRIRDKKNPVRVNFKGLDWYPVDKNYEVVAEFEPFGEDRDFLVQNVLDQTVQMKSPGILRFNLAGKEYSLQAALNGDGRLFIIFRDPTSKTTTYQAGRYLYTPMPKDGKVVLDFNKSENPPCAYTEFATCPLPPQQNELEVEILAGEKRFDEHQ